MKNLKLGDKLLLVANDNNNNSCETATEITKITKVVWHSVYATFATSENLVVDGIVGSSYVSLTGDYSTYLRDQANTVALFH